MDSWWTRFFRVLRHRSLDLRDTQRAIPPDMVERLMARVAASEQRHTGQIRICIEGGLPLSYVWRAASVRERAITQFGKLRVWDTEHNNGVLIYLLVAEHTIEILADRGIARNVDPKVWHEMVARMREQFREGHYEDGLTEAIAAVTVALVEQYPAAEGGSERHANELPDGPVVISN